MNLFASPGLAGILSKVALFAGALAATPAWAHAPDTMPAELRTAVSQTLRSLEPTGDGQYRALNPENRLTLSFDGKDLQLAPADKKDNWHWGMALTDYGAPGHLQPVGQAEVAVSERRVEYRRGAVTEWYENRPEGLEQGFTLARPPTPGSRELELRLSLNGDLKAEVDTGGHSARMRNEAGQDILAYRDLSVIDAKGKALPAQLAMAGEQIAIRINAAGAAWPIVVDPLIVNIQEKLTAQNTDGSVDQQADAYFGSTAAIDGDTALVGAPYQNCVLGTDCGAAYVYTRSGTAWNIQQKLTALNTDGSDDTTATSHFGGSVALNGDTALVGSQWRDCAAGEKCGAAYVYVRNGTGWQIQQKLTAQNTDGSDDAEIGAYFGSSAVLNGATAIVGADHRTCGAGLSCGAAYVYVRSGSTWGIQQKITAQNTDGTDDSLAKAFFGNAIALNEATAMIGAVQRTCGAGLYCGAAYIYTRSGSTWSIQQKLEAQNGDGSDDRQAYAYFAQSVALSGDTALAGAYGNSCAAGFGCGAAYLYVRSGTVWTIQEKLLAQNADGSDDGEADAYFGWSVALSGDLAAVGASERSCAAGDVCGAAYVYTRSGADWGIQQKLLAQNSNGSDDSEPNAYFGYQLALNGSTLLVGAKGVSCAAGSNCGAAYVYATPGASKTLTVTKSGKGTVTSSPSGINCGATCQAGFAKGSVVTLTATPAPGYLFLGWSGPCALKVQPGTVPPQLLCEVTMNKAKQVKTKFVKILPNP